MIGLDLGMPSNGGHPFLIFHKEIIMATKRALITLPTYNERDNVELVLNELLNLHTTKKTNYHISVLVIDDRSPDGTADVVRLMQQKYKNLYLIQGRKNGLGAAYRRGFDYARKNLKFNVVIMMDADLSHSPTEVPHLLKKIDQGYDIAVGSRYVNGGMIPGSWPLIRILNTRVAHFVARFVGGIETDMAELTGGFKAMTKNALCQIPYRRARVSGFGFQLFLSNTFITQGFRVAEVPITFRDRRAGTSKLSHKDIVEFIRVAHELNPVSPFKRLMRQYAAAFGGAFVTIVTHVSAVQLSDFDAVTAALLATELGLLTVAALLLTLDKPKKAESAMARVRRLITAKYNTLAFLVQPLIASLLAVQQLDWQWWIGASALIFVAWFGIKFESSDREDAE